MKQPVVILYVKFTVKNLDSLRYITLTIICTYILTVILQTTPPLTRQFYFKYIKIKLSCKCVSITNIQFKNLSFSVTQKVFEIF